MNCSTVTFTRHAIERMFFRAIAPQVVVALIERGEVITSYSDDKPHPSVLLLGFVEGSPLHVVVARDEGTGDCYVVTVYVPDPTLWSDDFRTRRKS